MLHLSKQEFRGNKEYCLGVKHHYPDHEVNEFITTRPQYMDAEIFSKNNCLWRVLIVEENENPEIIASYWMDDYFHQLYEVLTQFTIKTRCQDGVLPKGRA